MCEAGVDGHASGALPNHALPYMNSIGGRTTCGESVPHALSWIFHSERYAACVALQASVAGLYVSVITRV